MIEEHKGPQVVLKFDLHRDSEELNGMLKASDYHLTIWNIKQYFHSIYNGKNYKLQDWLDNYDERIKTQKDGESDSEKDKTDPSSSIKDKYEYYMLNKICEDIFEIIEDSKFDEGDYI